MDTLADRQKPSPVLSMSEFGIAINIIIVAAVVVDDEMFTELI